MADAVLRLAAGRPRLRRRRPDRRRPAVRRPGRLRPAGRRRARARAQADRRRRAEPRQLARTRGSSRRSPTRDRRCGSGSGSATGSATARRTTGRASSAARRGRRESPTGQWYLHLFDSAQPDLDWRSTGGARGVPAGAALLAGPGRRRLPHRRRARAVQEPDAGGPPAGDAELGRRPARVGPRRGARRLRAVARAARLLRRRPDDGRRGLPVRRAAHRPVRLGQPAAPGLQLHRHGDALGRAGAAADDRHGAAALLARHVGAQQPRPGPARDPLRRGSARPAPRSGRHGAAAGAARLAVPLPGRGARPGRGRRARGPAAGPRLPAQRRRGRRPRRLPHAAALGGRRARPRLHHRRAVAALRRGRGGAGRGPAGGRPRLGAVGVPAAAAPAARAAARPSATRWCSSRRPPTSWSRDEEA